MIPYSPRAERIATILRGAREPGDENAFIGRALYSILNEPSIVQSALARALLEEKVWRSDARRYLRETLAGNLTYKHQMSQYLGAMVRMDQWLEKAEGLAIAGGSPLVGEQHLAQALRDINGPNLDSMLGRLGINGQLLAERVTELEGEIRVESGQQAVDVTEGRNGAKLGSDALNLLAAAHDGGGDVFRVDSVQGTVVQTVGPKPFVLGETARARYALEELERAGFLKQESHGHYVVTVDGRDFAQSQTADNVAARSAAAHETDTVTGIGNRAYLESASRELFEKCQAEGIPCSAFFMDTDDFKAFNQQYGHRVGDKVLNAVAQTASRAIRLRGGVIGRWGTGDEIVATMSNLTLPEVAALGERIREAMEGSTVDGMRVTVSVGVASAIRLPSVEELWDRADQALHAAKRLGKNRVAAHEF